MLMGHRGGVRLPVRNRDIRRVLRSVLTLVQGLLRSSEDAAQAQSQMGSPTPMAMMLVMTETIGDVGATTTAAHTMMMIILR